MFECARWLIQFQIHSRCIRIPTGSNRRFEFQQAANSENGVPMARIACIMVADFSIAALVRSNPALAEKVLAIGKSLAPHAELDAVSVRARELGIRPGMTIAQARAISSDLIVVHRSPAAESSAHSALLDAAESVSPVVESGASGCVWLDLAGLNRIYSGEEEIAAQLTRCVRKVGMQPAIGIAANKELAHLAA